MSLCLSANAANTLETATAREGILGRLLRRLPIPSAPKGGGELMPAPTRGDVLRARQARGDETNSLLL